MAVCDICGKEFARKAGLVAHQNRKTPCKAPVQLIQKALVEAGVVEVESEFREGSKAFHKSLTKEQRQEEGIFFTPKKVRDRLFQKLADLGVKPTQILEPSFGSGEFLLDARRLYPEANLVGVEKNADLFGSVKCPGATLVQGDFLTWKGSANLILGNPPYFVLKDGKEVRKMYAEALTGRPNIFVLFLYKCLKEHLSEGGILAFIVPTSLYNCSYYQPLRNYIHSCSAIRHLETLVTPGFYETSQETTLVILQKGAPSDDFVFRSSAGLVYFSPRAIDLKTWSKDTTTLASLGLGCKTGSIVWNQWKEDLVDEQGTLLVYSSNLINGSIALGVRGQKKQYIRDQTKPTLSGPLILIERGYGNAFRFNCVLTDLKDFYAENHVNVIYPKTPDAVQHLARVYKSFQNETCRQFMETLIGNGSISSTDMETLMPIQ